MAPDPYDLWRREALALPLDLRHTQSHAAALCDNAKAPAILASKLATLNRPNNGLFTVNSPCGVTAFESAMVKSPLQTRQDGFGKNRLGHWSLMSTRLNGMRWLPQSSAH